LTTDNAIIGIVIESDIIVVTMTDTGGADILVGSKEEEEEESDLESNVNVVAMLERKKDAVL